MNMHASVYGRLGRDPQSIETRSGKPMTAASLAVAVDENSDGPPLWLGLVAFGRQAEDLSRHSKGDLVSASGRVQRRTWQDSEGATREQLQLVCDALISARTARPGGKRKKPSQSTQPERQGDFLDEPIPF